MTKTFIWKGFTKENEKDQGEVQSPNRRLALVDLKEAGVDVITLRLKSDFLKLPFSAAPKISSVDITMFFTHLATLLSAGLPMLTALKSLKSHFKQPKLKQWIKEVQAHITSGYPLSSALEKYPHYFDRMTCQWILAGERTGKIEKVLEQIARGRNQRERRNSKIKGLLVYPCFVTIIAVSVIVMLLVWVIPQWASLFATVKVPLPF